MPQSVDSVRPAEPRASQEGERRRERRVAANDPGMLQVLSPFSPETFHIHILDASRGGLKLRVPEFLGQGTIVQVYLKTTIATGEVRHCTRAGSSFHAGVKLGEVVER